MKHKRHRIKYLHLIKCNFNGYYYTVEMSFKRREKLIQAYMHFYVILSTIPSIKCLGGLRCWDIAPFVGLGPAKAWLDPELEMFG